MTAHPLASRLRIAVRRHAYSLCFLLLAALTAVLLGFFLVVSYRQTERTIAMSSANEAHVLASQLEAALRRIGATSDLVRLNLLPEVLAERLSEEAIRHAHGHLRALCRSFPEIRGHHYYDADGRLVFSNDPAAAAASIADQPYFRQSRQSPQKEVQFSETLPTAPLTMIASQAVLADDGTFRGLVVTPVDLGFFEDLFARMDVGKAGMVSIRRSDTSRLVVRWPAVAKMLNNPARDIPPQRQIEDGIRRGVVRYVGATDGVDRTFAFHSLAPYPFYVLVGRATGEQFAAWWRMAALTSALTGMGLAAMGLFLNRLRASEQRLRASEQHYQAIVESQHDAVCRWLPDTTLTFTNSTYVAMCAANGEESLIGRRWIDLVPVTERPAILAAHARLTAAPAPLSRESVARLKDGSTRHIHWMDVPLFDGDGRCAEVQSVGRDITELRRSEADRQRLHIQLVQAQKMEAIGTLAGGIAHDFNNILGTIVGYTEMALDACPPDSVVARDLANVLKASDRATALVRQILAFSRQTASERTTLAPAVIVRETVKLLRPSLPATIAIKTRIDETTRSIHADPVQVQQIVMNLCTNAFHAMETTGGTLSIVLADRDIGPDEVSGRFELQPGPFVELTVADTGTGIPPDIRDKIFEPYFTTKEMGKGTGMGLAIIHGIVTSYRGLIACDSVPGEGTRFRVALPALDRETGAGPKGTTGQVLPGRERILFVDDEPLLAELGKTMLERLGYEVTVRTSGTEALTAFRNRPDWFDAVVADQTMPGLTGMEMARQMLAIRPELPVILCTGYSSLVSRDTAMAMGIKGFALKPLPQKELSALLRQVLDAGRQPTAP
ncbi:hybrid sensor histidine kinase/response regulator [Desulfobulbus elongatus]|uniref:hybrid sensor histidine kinase/response regulator n=1 Tax=Desulfobulbus elongatus TaxID=53332 RepID=UPI0006867FC4|nr:hybrid sensor histidine kinase/response regulator [Desulfobulbus elongatus]